MVQGCWPPILLNLRASLVQKGIQKYFSISGFSCIIVKESRQMDFLVFSCHSPSWDALMVPHGPKAHLSGCSLAPKAFGHLRPSLPPKSLIILLLIPATCCGSRTCFTASQIFAFAQFVPFVCTTLIPLLSTFYDLAPAFPPQWSVSWYLFLSWFPFLSRCPI